MDPENVTSEDVFKEYYISYEDEPFERKQAHHPFAAVCFSLVFCISVPANCFLLWVLLKKRAWKKTQDNLLLQLTISHLCFTVTLPFGASYALHGWTFGGFACSFINGASVLGLNSYILILTALILHYYVDVVPVSCVSAPDRRKKAVLIASIVIWLVCAVISLEAAVNSVVLGHRFGEECFHFADIHVLLFNIYFQICLFFVIPLIIMTFCCVHMLITMKQSGVSRHGQALRLILGLIVIFFLCLAPYNIAHFLVSLAMFDVFQVVGHELYVAHVIISGLLSFHCCLNPLHHIFRSQRFREHLPLPLNAFYQRGDGDHDLSLMPAISANEESM